MPIEMNSLEYTANVDNDVGDPVIWMKCIALPKHACSCCHKEINQCPRMFLICLKPNYIYVLLML